MRIGKLISTGLGVVIIIAGFGITAAGAVAVAVTDSDGWINAPRVRINTETAALISADVNVDLEDAIDNRSFVRFDGFEARIDVTERNGKEVFVGIGPTADVDAYLQNVGHATVDLFGDDVEVTSMPGALLAAAPAEQTFWAVSATDGSLAWDLETGDWTIAVLNADGSPNVDVSVTGAAYVPFVEAVGIGLLIGGVLTLLGGAALLYLGVRRVPGTGLPPASTPEAPAPAPQPEEPQPVS